MSIAALTPIPTAPERVDVVYPDGSRIDVDVDYAGRLRDREHWQALIPLSAKLVNGMIVHIDQTHAFPVVLTAPRAGDLA